MWRKNFLWGCATAAFQIEGGSNDGGRGPSIWDAFCQIPGKILDNSNGEIACDSYHRYKEDVALLKELGVNSYRFSLSWSRIMPTGRGEINYAGIDYYNNLINELIANDITPFITLYHWDLPLELQLAHDGWLNSEIINDFCNYAKVCFDAFGDRVKNWITFNEPWCICGCGYGLGSHAPGRKSDREAFIAGHNLLLAHAYTVELFRKNNYDGKIGITLSSGFNLPLTNTAADIDAAQRTLEFTLGWFGDPLFFGEYPRSMRDRLADILPEFTAEEQKLLTSGCDFLGINHYYTNYTSDNFIENSIQNFPAVLHSFDSLDASWKTTQMGWSIVPIGFRKLLKWIKDRYGDIPILVTENGCAVDDDQDRCDYIGDYTQAMIDAIEIDKVNVRGYFYWSLMDNFEWGFGYTKQFGIIECSPENTNRRPKKSFYFYKDLISKYCASEK
ncbi:MAG: beta-glucosidase [Lentisphaeria bacterium]|nr:beta-glucosidase [Lentisphaeria bacterium]